MKTFDYKIVNEHNIIVYLNGKEYEGYINHASYFISLKGQSFTFLFDELDIKNPKQYYESILGYCIDMDCYSPPCKSPEDLLKVLDKMKEDFSPFKFKVGDKVFPDSFWSRIDSQPCSIEIESKLYCINSIMINFMKKVINEKIVLTVDTISKDYVTFVEDIHKKGYPVSLIQKYNFTKETVSINFKQNENYEIKFQNPKASFTRGSVPTGRSIRCRTNKITITSGCLGYSEISFGS